MDQSQQQARAAKTEYRSFISPDDALRELRRLARQGAKIRWEMHMSRTDVDQAARTRCSCHSLTPQRAEMESRRHPERGDLRKHHSAEGDKWSLKPDQEHDLRKHLSDDCRMDRELKWTLQVPEVHANPKQRCTCPKPPPRATLSPSPSGSDDSRRYSPWLQPDDQRRSSLRLSRSLTPELPMRQKRLSADSRSSRERSPQVVQVEPQPPIQQPEPLPQPLDKAAAKKASKKERAQISESRKALRSKWAVKPHFSLPAERKDSKWVKPHDDYKSKSLKERHKYSVRRSMSPDPDPRQMLRLDNRIVRRLISPDIAIMETKWAPYEGYSPLPNVGVKKRETKKISDIKWVPYDESPVQPGKQPDELPPPELIDEDLKDPPKDWSPFHNITPTHLPPPVATPARNAEEEFRWRFLNQVSAFPIYQGAWREESPPPTPPPVDLSTPVWSPQPPEQQKEAILRKQSTMRRPPPSPSPPPTPPQKRSTLKLRSSSKKKAMRAKSQESTRQRKDSHQLPTVEEPRQQQQQGRRRPQLLRSKALLLEVPHIDPSKRSLSEEVRSYNRNESTKQRVGLIFRAKSEDAARYPWFADDERQELREYVTTV